MSSCSCAHSYVFLFLCLALALFSGQIQKANIIVEFQVVSYSSIASEPKLRLKSRFCHLGLCDLGELLNRSGLQILHL